MNLFYKLFRHTQNSHQQTVKYFEGVFKMKKQYVSRRFVGLALIAALTLPTAAAAQANVKQISARFGVQISVNGVTQHLTDAAGNPVQAFEYNGTTYVPIRGVAQALGAQVGYDASTDTALITANTYVATNPDFSSYKVLSSMYRTADMMEAAMSNGIYTLSLDSQYQDMYFDNIPTMLQTNTNNYNHVCNLYNSLPSSASYYEDITTAKSYLDDLMYNFKQFCGIMQNKNFSSIYLEKLNTYMADAQLARTMVETLSATYMTALE